MTHSTVAFSRDPAPGVGALDRTARRGVHAVLSRIRHGCVILEDAAGERRFGEAGTPAALEARVRIAAPRAYRRIALGGEISAIQSYADGEWDCDDLVALGRILFRNGDVQTALGGGTARLAGAVRRLSHRLRRNTRSGSRRNIAAHYDLGNDFYALFLDPTMTYSAGIFETPRSSLEAASRAKYERLCRKLALGPSDRVVEIGTGWGGFALHAAGRYGCHVTTATISRAQHEWARERVARAGLEGRITLLLEDYRDVRGEFDKLVSIEMIEAVGHPYHETFFEACGRLLAPDGRMALQAIVVPDRRYEAHRRSTDFIKHHIFPGGCLVSVGRIGEACAAAGDLQMVHLEDITPHYADTLRCWRENLEARRDEARALGYGDDLLRLWECYLAFCEAGFRERTIGDVQVVLARSASRHAPVLGTLGEAPDRP